jgi:hypothetical protein
MNSDILPEKYGISSVSDRPMGHRIANQVAINRPTDDEEQSKFIPVGLPVE